MKRTSISSHKCMQMGKRCSSKLTLSSESSYAENYYSRLIWYTHKLNSKGTNIKRGLHSRNTTQYPNRTDKFEWNCKTRLAEGYNRGIKIHQQASRVSTDISIMVQKERRQWSFDVRPRWWRCPSTTGARSVPTKVQTMRAISNTVHQPSGAWSLLELRAQRDRGVLLLVEIGGDLSVQHEKVVESHIFWWKVF